MKDLGLTVNQILRYGFGGILLFLLAAIIEPYKTWQLVDILGEVFFPFIALAIGILIYVFYRPILGRWILWPFFDLIHGWFESMWGYKKNQANTHNCKRKYLINKFKVAPARNAIDAYRLIRDNKFDKEVAESFQTQHSEIHLLYITFIVIILAAPYIYFVKGNINWAIFSCVMAIACLTMGMVSDIQLCRVECAYMKTLSDEEVTNLLKRAGYSKL